MCFPCLHILMKKYWRCLRRFFGDSSPIYVFCAGCRFHLSSAQWSLQRRILQHHRRRDDCPYDWRSSQQTFYAILLLATASHAASFPAAAAVSCGGIFIGSPPQCGCPSDILASGKHGGFLALSRYWAVCPLGLHLRPSRPRGISIHTWEDVE